MNVATAFIERNGGPEVIQWRDGELDAPGKDQVSISHEAVGLNYIDTYFRTGLYPAPLPTGLGMEAAGTVVEVGSGVTGFSPGDRVAYSGQLGAYATGRLIDAGALYRLPDGVDTQMAAAALLKGCTAEFLAERCAPLDAGDWALVPAAAGGVGLLLVQWLKARGVRVIGTVGSQEKRDLAFDAGAEAVVLADDPDLVGKVRAHTGGAGVKVSYDGVGAASWEISLKSLARRGTLVSFGNASGPVTGIELGTLARHGSLYVTRPTMFDYYADRVEREAGSAKLWEMIMSGKLKVTIGQIYPLREAAQAHRDLEARKTTGSTLLIP